MNKCEKNAKETSSWDPINIMFSLLLMFSGLLLLQDLSNTELLSLSVALIATTYGLQLKWKTLRSS